MACGAVPILNSWVSDSNCLDLKAAGSYVAPVSLWLFPRVGESSLVLSEWGQRWTSRLSIFFPSYFHGAIFLSYPPPPPPKVEEVMARVYLGLLLLLMKGFCCITRMAFQFLPFLCGAYKRSHWAEDFSPPPPFSLFVPTLIFLRSTVKNNILFVSQDEPCLSWLVGIVMKAWPWLASLSCCKSEKSVKTSPFPEGTFRGIRTLGEASC